MRNSLARHLKLFVGLFLFAFLLLIPSSQAEPISIILASIAAAITVKAVVGALVTAIIGAAISFGISAIVGAISKKKTPGLKAGIGGGFAEAAGQRVNFSRSSVESHKIVFGRVRISGPLVYLTSTNRTTGGGNVKKNDFLHMVIALAAHEIEEIENLVIDDNVVTLNEDGYVVGDENGVLSAKYRDSATNYIRVKMHLGTEDQEADPDLSSEVVQWTEDHRLQGIAYIYLRLQYNQNIFPNGVPNFSVIMKGNNQIYDPRDLSTGYSTNPVLCSRWYLANTRYGLGATDSEIDDPTFIASANICDEDVTLADGSTQKRYTCNGVIDTANKPIEIIKDLVTSMAGAVPYVQGKFRCFAGAYTTPSVSMDASWLAGPLEVQAKTPRNELFNAAKGVFVDPDKNWQPTDVPIVTNATYETQDGGHRIIRDFELPFTTNGIEGQRILKIALEKGRQGIMVTAPCNFKALQLSIWDTVEFTISQLGWTDKVFRVIQWELNLEGGFTVTMQEESSASYDWNNGEATEYDAAPDTNLPDPNFVYTPGNPVVTESLYDTTDGSGVKTKAILTWSESEDAFIYRYVVRYKLTTDTDYINVGEFISNSCTIFDIGPGTFNFEVKAVNINGVGSDFAATTKEIFGLTAAPANVSTFSLNVLNNQAHLRWAQATDLDVKVGGSFVIKWSSKTSGATWSDGITLADDISGISTNIVLELLPGTYMIKAQDSTGNQSEEHAAIITTVPNLLRINNVATLDQHPGFAGTKTGMIVDADDDTLMLDGDGLFDDVSGNFDDAPGFFDAGGGSGFETEGTYEFDNHIDLGAVYTCRVTMDIEALVYDGSETFDEADGLFDDREGLFDGNDRANVDVSFYIRTTDDDPSATPSWGEWRKFVIGDYTARAFEFKTEIDSAKSSNNIKISRLSASVDVPDIVQEFQDQAIADIGTTLTYDKPFFAKPRLEGTIESAQNGDQLKYTHVTSGGKYTGVTVNVNNGGSGVARTCDIYAIGF